MAIFILLSVAHFCRTGGIGCAECSPPSASSLACGGQPAGEVSQAALETLHEFWGDGRLAFGVTAGRFGARVLGLVEAKRVIQQLVGIG